MVSTRCANEADLSQVLASANAPLKVRIGRPAGAETPGTLYYAAEGVMEHADVDQVVVIHSGTTFADLNRELSKHGQVIPFVEPLKRPHRARCDAVAVGQVAAMDIPHAGQGLVGSFRDWVLGLTAVLADGTVVKCGSKAVKNVAGYDLHKLFLGSRHTLGVITQMTLRTYPLGKFENLTFEWTQGDAIGHESDLWVHRTPRSKFDEAVSAAGSGLVLADRDSSTVWAYHAGGPAQRFPGDWAVRPNVEEPPEISNPAERKIMASIKAKFDPRGQLSPGEFGFL